MQLITRVSICTVSTVSFTALQRNTVKAAKDAAEAFHDVVSFIMSPRHFRIQLRSGANVGLSGYSQGLSGSSHGHLRHCGGYGILRTIRCNILGVDIILMTIQIER